MSYGVAKGIDKRRAGMFRTISQTTDTKITRSFKFDPLISGITIEPCFSKVQCLCLLSCLRWGVRRVRSCEGNTKGFANWFHNLSYTLS